jgi:hypothetical protein
MTTATPEIAEGELLPDVIDSPAPITLFGTSDPQVALERMSEVASVLVDVIKDRKLYARISGHEHVTAEGWTTLGGMLGIVPVVVWTKPNESGDGYLARVEARTLDGRLVGAAESECSRAERKWKNADAYAIRSMAQTRAIGRALRAPLGQIVVLAGYEPAGAEEISEDPPARPSEEATASLPVAKIPPEHQPTAEQKAELAALLRTLDQIDPDTGWAVRCRELVGAPWSMTTATMAGMLIEKLQAEIRRLVDEADHDVDERRAAAQG